MVHELEKIKVPIPYQSVPLLTIIAHIESTPKTG